MMSKIMRKISIVVLGAFLSLGVITNIVSANVATQSHWQKDKPYYITILHTNDHHGRFWQNDIGEYGLAAQKTLVDKIRKEVADNGGQLLLLSGGDVNTGVPESDILNAEPDFKAMDKIGYDAMVIGNHEFDHPLAVIRQQQEWVNFPFLSSNIYFKESGKRVFSPYKVFNKQGIKIAVLGLTTDDTPVLTSPENTKGIEFRKIVPEAKLIINEIKKVEKPDLIFALTHIGHYPDGKHGSMTSGDVHLARSLTQGDLDLIVGGHSHDLVCMVKENQRIAEYVPGTPCSPDKQNGTWIVQAYEWGKYIGRADFVFLNGKFTLNNYQLIPINLKQSIDKDNDVKTFVFYTQEIPQDQTLLKFLTPYQEKGQKALFKIVGKLNGRLEGARDKVRYQQTNMGQMLLSAFIEKANADIGIMTGGMIRDSMIEGDISYRDILKVEPFGNSLVYFELTGKQLIDYLQVAVNKTTGSGSYAHFRNIEITLDGNKIIDLKINKKPLDLNKTYRIATLSFLAAGGDGYPKVNDLPNYVDTGYRDADVVKQYFEKHAPINAKDYEPSISIINHR